MLSWSFVISFKPKLKSLNKWFMNTTWKNIFKLQLVFQRCELSKMVACQEVRESLTLKMRSTLDNTTSNLQICTISNILILLVMRRWQDGSLSISFHWPETAVSSYSFLILLKHYTPLWSLSSIAVFLLSFRSLAPVCQFIFLIIFRYSSAASVQRFSGFPLFLPFWQAVFVLAIFHYSAFQYVLTILIWMVMYLTLSAPCNTLLTCSYSSTFFFLYGTINFYYNVALDTLRTFISSEVIFQASSRILTWVVLKFSTWAIQ